MAASTVSARPASGRFVLRLGPELHSTLRMAARDMGVSLNEYCVRKLAAPAGSATISEGASETLRKAMALLGDGLVGVVVYGSWARGEAVDTSDVDVLVVLDHGVDVTRQLYREWDRVPVTWDGHLVEPHFVRLPDTSARVTGLWAEVARDGIVVFERRFQVSRHLIRTRTRLMDGRTRRHSIFGQPYWVEETANEES